MKFVRRVVMNTVCWDMTQCCGKECRLIVQVVTLHCWQLARPARVLVWSTGEAFDHTVLCRATLFVVAP